MNSSYSAQHIQVLWSTHCSSVPQWRSLYSHTHWKKPEYLQPLPLSPCYGKAQPAQAARSRQQHCLHAHCMTVQLFQYSTTRPGPKSRALTVSLSKIETSMKRGLPSCWPAQLMEITWCIWGPAWGRVCCLNILGIRGWEGACLLCRSPFSWTRHCNRVQSTIILNQNI